MIISRTPLRISFMGGGTDFREFFRGEDGWVVSSAIDKYIYVIVKERFDDKIRVGYTKTELVDHIDEIEHELVRECLRITGTTQGVEITTMADIPSAGSGLGSSSTVTVGLLNALYCYQGKSQEAETLAKQACEIEIDVLGKPIGLQDQYIAAYGGQRFIHFYTDDTIDVEPLGLSENQQRRLNQDLMLFYTSITRKSETVLVEQIQNIDSRLEVLQALKGLARQVQSALNAGAFHDFGLLLHQGWSLKKQMAGGISNGVIDVIYQAARDAGALGGKITGAGGGGFLLLYCPQAHQDDVRTALHGFSELPFQFEPHGTKIIFHV